MHGYINPGRPKLDFATFLCQDKGLSIRELSIITNEREPWRSFIKDLGAPSIGSSYTAMKKESTIDYLGLMLFSIFKTKG